MTQKLKCFSMKHWRRRRREGGTCTQIREKIFFGQKSCKIRAVSQIFSPKGLLSDDVINDVIRPGSTIREDHIDTPYR